MQTDAVLGIEPRIFDTLVLSVLLDAGAVAIVGRPDQHGTARVDEFVQLVQAEPCRIEGIERGVVVLDKIPDRRDHAGRIDTRAVVEAAGVADVARHEIVAEDHVIVHDIVDIEIVAEMIERGGQGEGFAPRLHAVELSERLDVVDDAEIVFQLCIQDLIVFRLSELVDGRRLGGRLGRRERLRLGRFDDRRGIGRCFDIFRAGGTKQ